MGSVLNRRRRAVLVELSPDHGWVLFSQCLLLLEEGFDVSVVVHETNRDLELLLTLEGRIRFKVVSGGSLGTLTVVLKEQLREKADLVTINTVNCRSLWLTAMVTLGPLSVVLHNLDDFGFGRKRSKGFLGRLLLSRSKKLIVLSPKLKERAFQTLPPATHPKVSVFFPMFYGPSGEKTDRAEPSALSGRLTVVIPGSVCSRRNYESLAEIFPHLSSSPLLDRVVIRVLGDSSSDQGQWLRKVAAESASPDQIVFEAQKGYLSHWEFFERVAGADCILPLIDRSVIKEWGYNQTSAPSSLMLSRAFSVPLICSTDLDLDDDLRLYSMMYEADHVRDGLLAAIQAHEDGTLAQMKSVMAKSHDEWQKASRHNYLDDVGDDVV
ncbi:MAG: hypothetical protein DRJ61_09910 [Acidobacteria bacterium]|nr:MAG: hypothetical protein DRJ61_09910 [Acidobacteriota bacterium]